MTRKQPFANQMYRMLKKLHDSQHTTKSDTWGELTCLLYRIDHWDESEPEPCDDRIIAEFNQNCLLRLADLVASGDLAEARKYVTLVRQSLVMPGQECR